MHEAFCCVHVPAIACVHLHPNQNPAFKSPYSEQPACALTPTPTHLPQAAVPLRNAVVRVLPAAPLVRADVKPPACATAPTHGIKLCIQAHPHTAFPHPTLLCCNEKCKLLDGAAYVQHSAMQANVMCGHTVRGDCASAAAAITVAILVVALHTHEGTLHQPNDG
jgi:hypothetical protein